MSEPTEGAPAQDEWAAWKAEGIDPTDPNAIEMYRWGRNLLMDPKATVNDLVADSPDDRSAVASLFDGQVIGAPPRGQQPQQVQPQVQQHSYGEPQMMFVGHDMNGREVYAPSPQQQQFQQPQQQAGQGRAEIIAYDDTGQPIMGYPPQAQQQQFQQPQQQAPVFPQQAQVVDGDQPPPWFVKHQAQQQENNARAERTQRTQSIVDQQIQKIQEANRLTDGQVRVLRQEIATTVNAAPMTEVALQSVGDRVFKTFATEVLGREPVTTAPTTGDAQAQVDAAGGQIPSGGQPAGTKEAPHDPDAPFARSAEAMEREFATRRAEVQATQ